MGLVWVNMRDKTLPDGTDYFTINSKGAVPALELPDGQRLSEGAVIMQYLADLRPQSKLIAPHGTLERYRVLEWMSFIAADLHKGRFMPLFKPATPPGYREIARKYLQRHLRWLDAQLSDRQFLTGSTFTIADAHCYTISMWAKVVDVDTAGMTHLHAYLARVGGRKSVIAAELAARAQGERAAALQASAMHLERP